MDRLNVLKPLFNKYSVQKDVGALESDNFILRRQEDSAFLLHKVEVVRARRDHGCAHVCHVVHCVDLSWDFVYRNVNR